MNSSRPNPTVKFSDRIIKAVVGQSLLEAIESEGLELPSSCRSGVCQSCLVKAIEGQPPSASQKGLKPTLRHSGYFLACLCYPEQDLVCVVGADGHGQELSTVVGITSLSPQVKQIRLSISASFLFEGGQFINLRRADGLIRSYSIASIPAEGSFLDIHVRHVPDGQMSSWLHDDLRVGDGLEFSGPHGDCFYLQEDKAQALLLVGTGTGIAPLYAILKQALREGHQGPITFVQGARDRAGLYLVDELQALADEHPHLTYIRCLEEAEPDEDAAISLGRIDDVVMADIDSYRSSRVFLCGNPAMVNALRKRLFLAGLSMKNISSDAFVASKK